jgi:hypothetical protein
MRQRSRRPDFLVFVFFGNQKYIWQSQCITGQKNSRVNALTRSKIRHDVTSTSNQLHKKETFRFRSMSQLMILIYRYVQVIQILQAFQKPHEILNFFMTAGLIDHKSIFNSRLLPFVFTSLLDV